MHTEPQTAAVTPTLNVFLKYNLLFIQYFIVLYRDLDLQEVEASRFQDIWHMKMVQLLNQRTGLL
jgi:hypothetical protein